LLTPLNIPATLDVVLIKPRVGLATAEVFAEYATHQGGSVDDRVAADNILGACASGRAPEIGKWLYNRLVDSALRLQETSPRSYPTVDTRQYFILGR